MKRKASAQWQGDLKTGKGAVSTESGVLESAAYSFTTRFENGKGTNPEELIAAAHAGCFTMALSAELQKAGLKADSIDTTCKVRLEKEGDGFAIKKSQLELRAKIPNAEKGFRAIFSAQQFPGSDFKLEWRREESGGNWYYSDQFKMEGWLCPALLKYFPSAPREISSASACASGELKSLASLVCAFFK